MIQNQEITPIPQLRIPKICVQVLAFLENNKPDDEHKVNQVENQHDGQGKLLCNMSGIINNQFLHLALLHPIVVWDVETGATDHMVIAPHPFLNLHQLNLHLLDSLKALFAFLIPHLTLSIPKFSVNLISISKLTKIMNCCIILPLNTVLYRQLQLEDDWCGCTVMWAILSAAKLKTLYMS